MTNPSLEAQESKSVVAGHELKQILDEIQAADQAGESGATQGASSSDASLDISINRMLEELPQLSMEITRNLTEISVKLSRELALLDEVGQAVAQKKLELERLHKMEVIATGLRGIAAEYGRQKEKVETEQIEEYLRWEAEKKNHEEQQKAYLEALAEERRKEAEEYARRAAEERERERREHEEKLRTLEAQAVEKQQALEANWRLREAALRQREEEFLRLRSDVEAFFRRLSEIPLGGEVAGGQPVAEAEREPLKPASDEGAGL